MTTQTPDLQAVVERLEKVETQNRRLKLMGALVLALAGAALLMGQAQPNRRVEAEMFVLKDANGKVRAELGMAAHGPVLALYDEDGTRRAALGMAEKGLGLFLFDAIQKRRVTLGVTEKGPIFALFDEDGKPLFFKP